MENLEKLNKIYWGKETILEWTNGFAVSLKNRLEGKKLFLFSGLKLICFVPTLAKFCVYFDIL